MIPVLKSDGSISVTGKGWVRSERDPRAGVMREAPREGLPQGGWRCAGAMFPGDAHDHVVSLPFYVADDRGDLRHCCYCADCAAKILGVTP